MTAEQVGKELLQCSSKSVYKLRKADPSMPVLEFNGLVRFPRQRLLEWLAGREQGRARRARIRSRAKPALIAAKSASDKEAARG